MKDKVTAPKKETLTPNVGDRVRIVIEGEVSESGTAGDTGWFNIEADYDSIYFEVPSDVLVSIEVIDPPFIFPEGEFAVISGVRIKGSDDVRWMFAKTGNVWQTMNKEEATAVWPEARLLNEFTDLQVEWTAA